MFRAARGPGSTMKLDIWETNAGLRDEGQQEAAEISQCLATSGAPHHILACFRGGTLELS